MLKNGIEIALAAACVAVLLGLGPAVASARPAPDNDWFAEQPPAPDVESPVRPSIGEVIPVLPLSHEAVLVDGLKYYVSAGVFFLRGPTGYVVVEPPLGAALRRLPADHAVVAFEGIELYYHDGTFYARGPLDLFSVVEAPVGAVVPSLPQGATSVYADGVLEFDFRGVRYRPRYRESSAEYVVVDPPPVAAGGDAEDASGSIGCQFLGVEGRYLDRDALAYFLNLDGDGGVLIEQVAAGSPAEDGGLQGGFIPAEIGGEEILLGGDLLLALEFPWLCQGDCLVDAPRLAAEMNPIAATFLRGGRMLKTVLHCGERDR